MSAAIAKAIEPIDAEVKKYETFKEHEFESSNKSDEDFYWRYWHSNDGKHWMLWNNHTQAYEKVQNTVRFRKHSDLIFLSRN